MQSRIIMDIDDVISTHRNRDYENAIPNIPIIEKMQQLANQGITFILFTARGQVSCNGDIKKIEEEKGPTLRAWLARYNVPYSELKFGKPIGDVYVDDAAMTPSEFLTGDFLSFKGGSNEYIEQLGKFVVKECKNDNATIINDWFNIARKYGYNVPDVYAITYNKMRMEFIQGRAGNTIPFECRPNLAIEMALIAMSFAQVPGTYKFKIREYAKYLDENYVDASIIEYIILAKCLLIRHAENITPSFCHGDLTTMNAIIRGYGRIYLIDPVIHNDFSSYMIDLAKLRMSFNGYNQLLYPGIHAEEDKLHLVTLDVFLNNLGILDVIRVLEFTCWVRLIKYRYGNMVEFQNLISNLRRLSKEVCDL